MSLRTIPHSLNFVVDEFALSAQDNYGYPQSWLHFFEITKLAKPE